MTRERIELGKFGEDLAVKEIKRLGYKRIIRNYRCSTGELDLIAEDGDTLVFIEIKTRKSGPVSFAKEAVDQRKMRQVSKAALTYMKANNCYGVKARFDVVAVSILKDSPPEIEVIKNAFDLAY